mgnify:CR=1 FL=1
MMMLRTMNHAYYTTKKTSICLASRHYTHFTSPIRRYSDLSIHRLIKEYLQSGGRLNEHRIQHYDKRFIDASEQSLQLRSATPRKQSAPASISRSPNTCCPSSAQNTRRRSSASPPSAFSCGWKTPSKASSTSPPSRRLLQLRRRQPQPHRRAQRPQLQARAESRRRPRRREYEG